MFPMGQQGGEIPFVEQPWPEGKIERNGESGDGEETPASQDLCVDCRLVP